ncbi:piezo-type mechanosensitive ion channel component-like [Cylas formicarius]|uniref:piezo-type mechanosensitive ion channel component-like n=1 Tax=Cylas formicarius TaxID=197179 RepID=UPI0029587BA3|nr:piezo-type mechanosensitive ion channel component-like [Cylas formicarius]
MADGRAKSAGKHCGAYKGLSHLLPFQDNTSEDEFELIEIEEEPTFVDKITYYSHGFLILVMGSSYLIANFIMMVWGIAFVGWMAMVLLIWASLIWLLPNQKKIMLASSPFIVSWSSLALVVTYLYGLDLTEEELPSKLGIFVIDSYTRQGDRFVHLLVKTLCHVMLTVCLRQYMRERAADKQKRRLEEAIGVEETQTLTDFSAEGSLLFEDAMAYFNKRLTLYWIWIVGATMAAIAFVGQNSLLKLVYLVLFATLVLSFQLLPFKRWKQFLRFYWWLTICYAMFNLFSVYLYQFSFARSAIKQHLDDDTLNKLGYQHVQTIKQLFVKLAPALFFQIVSVLQLRYFQIDFDKLTDPSSEGYLDEEDNHKKPDSTWSRIRRDYSQFINVLFLICEFHLPKVAFVIAVSYAVFFKCFIFMVVVAVISLAQLFGKTATRFAIHFTSVVVCATLVSQLAYVLTTQNHRRLDVTCQFRRGDRIYNVTRNTAEWIGFSAKTDGVYSSTTDYSMAFSYIATTTIYKVAALRHLNRRMAAGISSTEEPAAMFPEVNFGNSHASFLNMVKYLADYGFYKFGLEVYICFGMCTIAMRFRMDLMALIYSIVLLIVFAMSRATLAKIWPVLTCGLAISLMYQYYSALGWPPSTCDTTVIVLPSVTKYWNQHEIYIRLQKWLFIRNDAYPPKIKKLLLDFVLLLLMVDQWRVFRIEKSYTGEAYPGGSNESVVHLIENKRFTNPVPDFISNATSVLDVIKKSFLCSLCSVSLFSMYLAGAMRLGIYTFGYLSLACIFLWEGSEMYLRPINSIIRRWNLLIAYTIVVMILRVGSQLLGCILAYYYLEGHCYVFHLLAVGCVDRFGDVDDVPDLKMETNCQLQTEHMGLGWDIICFCLLLAQRRLFYSYNFFHIVNDEKIFTILAFRGAELIEAMDLKKRKAIDEEDQQIRDKMKRKMEKIRKVHVRVQGENYFSRKQNHIRVLQSGDYYLFDEIDNDDIDWMYETGDDNERDHDPYDPMLISEFLIELTQNGIRGVLKERNKRRTLKAARMRGEDLGKASVPQEDRATTSSDADDIELVEEPHDSFGIVKVVWGFIEACVVSFTLFLNHKSSDLRDILEEMKRERLVLMKTDYYVGRRATSNQIWQPSESYSELLKSTQDQVPHGVDPINYSILGKLYLACWHFLLTRSEWWCYLIIILLQAVVNDFCSVPLPLLVFCWGTLVIPKPTRMFWVAIISYVLVMLIIKALFRLHPLPWSEQQNVGPFYPPHFLGLHTESKIGFDLVLLSLLFFHRTILRWLGLWKSTEYRTSTLLADGDYVIRDGQLEPYRAAQSTDAKTTPKTRQRMKIFNINSRDIALGDYFPKSVIDGARKYGEIILLFMQQLIQPSLQVPDDVYTPMFLCDLVNFFVLIFFFQSFDVQSEETGFIDYASQNTISVKFVIVTLAYFGLMLIDRWLYLRKNRFGKLVFHYTQVILFHGLLLIMIPLTAQRWLQHTRPLQVFYFFKCVYFLLSAHQIGRGYPLRIYGHCLWKAHGMFNALAFQLYSVIPYIFEIRTLIDWTCTDTSLTVSEWFKVEDITSNIYLQKCEQEAGGVQIPAGGRARGKNLKYLTGGCRLLFLILIIIAPLVIFSMGRSVSQTSTVILVGLKLNLGYYEAATWIFTSDLIRFDQEDYEAMQLAFNNIDIAEKTFDDFGPEDIVATRLKTYASRLWTISPIDYKKLVDEVNSAAPFSAMLRITIVRNTPSGESQTLTDASNIILLPPAPDPDRLTLAKMLTESESSSTPIRLRNILPKFVRVMDNGKIVPIRGVMENPRSVPENQTRKPDTFRNLLAIMRKDEHGKMWWEMREDCNPNELNYKYYLKKLIHNSCDYITLYVLSDKILPETLTIVTGGGVIGMYLLYFMMVFGFVRGIYGQVNDIWIQDMPYVDRIYQKCMELYIARDLGDFELEEEICSQLIFIMRSREMCIKLSREPGDPYNPKFLTPGSST